MYTEGHNRSVLLMPRQQKGIETLRDQSSSLLRTHRTRSTRLASRCAEGRGWSQTQQPIKLSVDWMGQLFETNQRLFRQSLAFRFPKEVRLRGAKGRLSELWGKQLRQDDYQMAKRPQMRHRRYYSNYPVTHRHNNK